MKKDNSSSREYVYGNVAYDLEKENIKKEKKQTRSPKKGKLKPKKNKVKKKLKLIGAIAVIFCMAFITVGRYTTILGLSTDIRNEKHALKDIQKENENMKVELAKMNNLKSIEDVARNKYKMVTPNLENTQFIAVNPLKPMDTKDKKTESSALSTIQRILGLIY